MLLTLCLPRFCEFVCSLAISFTSHSVVNSSIRSIQDRLTLILKNLPNQSSLSSLNRILKPYNPRRVSLTKHGQTAFVVFWSDSEWKACASACKQRLLVVKGRIVEGGVKEMMKPAYAGLPGRVRSLHLFLLHSQRNLLPLLFFFILYLTSRLEFVFRVRLLSNSRTVVNTSTTGSSFTLIRPSLSASRSSQPALVTPLLSTSLTLVCPFFVKKLEQL